VESWAIHFPVISPISDYPHHLLLLAPGDILQSRIAGTLLRIGLAASFVVDEDVTAHCGV
jgi:hypothetical protein